MESCALRFLYKTKPGRVVLKLLISPPVSKIAGAINGSRYYGLGELDFYSAKRYAPMTDFQGKVMTFTTTDFNRLHNPNKPIPSNRKKG